MQLEVGTVIGGALLAAAQDGTLQGRAVGAGRELVITGRRRATAGHAVYDAAQVGSGRQCVLTAWRRDADPDRAYAGRAAQAAASVAHPNLERLLAVGVDEVVGCVYVATPHSDAETLAAFTARTGGAPADQALHLLTQIGGALGAAHAMGFAHGGVRPANVLVMRDDSEASLAVSVCGQLFAPRDVEAAFEERLWLAPELASENAGAIDPRADVWAFGLLAFHVLTGGSYWRETSGELGAVASLAREVHIDPLVSASLRAAELGAILPLAFDAWFARCVAREPARRFADANDATAELARALAEASPALVADVGSLAPHLFMSADTAIEPARPQYTAQPPAVQPYAAQPPARPHASTSLLGSLKLPLSKLPFANGQPRWIAPAFASVALVCATAVVISLLARGDKPAPATSTDRASTRESDGDAPAASAEAPKVRVRNHWVVDAETEPRSKTVLVNVTPSAKLVDGFRSIALTLDSPRLRSAFSGLSLGASGSGFVLVKEREGAAAKEPAVFVVTNRHVVVEGEAVELTMDDGAKLGGDVVYTDFRHDVAIVSFTGKKPPVSTGLSLSSKELGDLAPVLATGYPFLAGKPSFQISKGEVRNRMFERAFDEEEAKEAYIQHSASIDPGSSGGPLLDENKDVVGINTGLLPEKHDVFLALPVPVIDTAVTRAMEIQENEKSAEWRVAGLQKACKELVAELASDKPRFRSFQQLVSNRLVSEEGLPSLLIQDALLLPGATTASPMDRMRTSVLMRLYLEASARGGVTSSACGDINPTDATEIVTTPVVRMTLQLGDGPAELGWTFEQGRWRIASAPLVGIERPAYPGAPMTKRARPRRVY